MMLSIDNLTLAYGEAEPVLEHLSLEVQAGRFVSLVGASGSGKSSVLRAVMGLQTPDSGTVSLGVPREQVGFLFQDDALLPWRTAAQNVALGLTIRGVAKAEALKRAHTWLGRLGLSGFEDRFPRRLSGGQRKRVALAQVLAQEPRLLLMDEPFASLDAIVRHRITQDVIAWTERERLTVLLVTHDLEEAISLSDAIYLLSNGPRARVRRRYEVALPRPRDPIATRTQPGFAPLFKRLWNDLEGTFTPSPPEARTILQEVADQ